MTFPEARDCSFAGNEGKKDNRMKSSLVYFLIKKTVNRSKLLKVTFVECDEMLDFSDNHLLAS